MPIHKLHSSFNAGELSPLMDSRVNVEKYEAGCRRLRNFILHTHGPVFRRPGLEYMGEAASHDVASRFIEFNFSATTTFVIEMTVGRFRFWSNGQLVTKTVTDGESGETVEVTATHPYAADELFEVQVKQVNDVCYLAHGNHPPLKLVRLANDDWKCEEVTFRYPPLLDEFVEKETVTTPTVTEIYDTALEEAPEFTLAPRTLPTNPTFTVLARPPGTVSVANSWFALGWTGWPTTPTGLAGKSVTVEVQKPTGEWVPVTALAAPIPHTSAPPPGQDYRFKATTPPSKNLVVERKATSEPGWSASTLLGFFAEERSSAPDLTFRLAYGPPLVNDMPDNKVTVTPGAGATVSGPLMDSPYFGALQLVHMLQTPTSQDITATWTMPGFVPAERTLSWQMVNASNNWAYLWHWGPSTTPLSAALNGTSAVFRLRTTTAITGVTYATLEQKQAAGHWVAMPTSVPISQALLCNVTQSIPTITTASTAGRIIGERVTGAGIPAGTTIIAINSAMQLTLSHNATETHAGAWLAFARPTPWNVRLLFGREDTQGIGTQVVTCNIASGSAVITLAGAATTAVRRVGELVSGPGIPAGTTIASIPVSPVNQFTLSAVATATNAAVNLTFTSDAYIALNAIGLSHVMKLERQESGTGADAAKSGVTVPAGNWRARVAVAADATVPAGASVTLQKWVPIGTGGAWSNITTWPKLVAGVTNEYVGQLTGAFTTDTLVRLLYKGGVSLRRIAGEGTIDTVVFPPSKAVTLQVNSAIGTGTMLARDTSTTPQPVALFQPGHVGSFWQIAHRRDLSSTQIATSGDSAPIRVSGKWDLFTYGTWAGTVHLQRRGASNVWQTIRSWTSASDRNVASTGNEEEDVDLRLSVALTGAVGSPRFVLEAADSRTYGLVKITNVVSDSEATVEIVRTLGATTPTPLWAEGAWSKVRGYPAAVGMHEARLWFGGSRYQPQTLWASVSGDFENFRRSTMDDGSLALTLAAESSNSIRWLSSSTALLIGTGGEEWALRSSAEGAAITGTTARVERQSGYSSMALGAKLAHEVTVFVQRDGRRLRQLSYTQAQQSFTASDLTVLAPHVTAAGVRQLAFQQAPTAVLWVVTGDGKLAGMTFEREQNVFGWHVHETDGEIETIAVLHGTPADEVWLGVRRRIVDTQLETAGITAGSAVVTLPGTAARAVGEAVAGEGIPADAVIVSVDSSTQLTLSAAATRTDAAARLEFRATHHKRYVERMQPQAMAGDWSAQRTLIYADAAKVYQFDTPRADLTGVDHLEGRECVILTDGALHRNLVVRDGVLTLDAPASQVVVGLPFTSELQPMKQEVQLEDGTAQGRRFKLHGATVRVGHSQGGEVSANPEDATLPWSRLPNPIVLGGPAPLFTGERDLILESRHDAAVNLTVRQREPLPLNVTALILRFDVYGD